MAVSLPQYLSLLNWTARQIRNGSSGRTPENLAPLFERLDISVDVWLKLVPNFRRYHTSVAGHPDKVESIGSGVPHKKFQLSSSGNSCFVHRPKA